MLNSQKFFVGLFVLLVFVFLSELVYIFYYQPMQSKKAVIPTQTIAVQKEPVKPVFVYDENLASLDGSLVKNFVLNAEKNKFDFISKVSLLNSLAKINNPQKESYFQLDNQSDKWSAYSDEVFPVTFNELVLIKLKFDSKTGPSGITFGGYAFKEKEDINIFFGTGEDGKKLYIDAKNNSDIPFILYEGNFENKLDGIYILFNKKGNSFLVTDLFFERIISINMNKETDNKFPDGLFPNNQFYIGYSIAPQSNLVVFDLSILPIK